MLSKAKLLICIVLSAISFNTSAQENILSSAPSTPQSSMQRPSGFRSCDIIPGGFYHGTWQTTHLRCYKHHSVWETGHFQCAKQRHHSCRDWNWIPGHWVLF